MRSSRRYLVPQWCVALLLVTWILERLMARTDIVSALLSQSTSASLPEIAMACVTVVFRLFCVLVSGPALVVWAMLEAWDLCRRPGAGK